MTENDKKLLQAKRRLEEAEMRDRQKERKARTRRLIQTGAILEKIYPESKSMNPTELEEKLKEIFEKYNYAKAFISRRAKRANERGVLSARQPKRFGIARAVEQEQNPLSFPKGAFTHRGVADFVSFAAAF